ncbi:PH domain-containing protein [Gracilibacillus sp. S3-1-1]|uniref:PH domain-containing protein n=1 Tax=Gracilibacillus pellucidus TaxID=3095368 RepID=A0ACC6M404_9BACI|nr:PH domain-containing protein [Gracilibacillus sp. S3-1-1]MDX8045623.1 PH domain-containing protein [Gracilibacillus sp. S3-1-1]
MNPLENRVSEKFPKVLITSETIGNIIGFIVLGVLFWLKEHFEWPTWIGWVLIILLILCIIGTVWSYVKPRYVYQSWRYQVDETYLQLSYGVLNKEWVTVPMTKIQAVTTSQGPIMRAYQLRSIKVETMGSSHEIPALEEEVALQLREQIATYAQLKEVDE